MYIVCGVLLLVTIIIISLIVIMLRTSYKHISSTTEEQVIGYLPPPDLEKTIITTNRFNCIELDIPEPLKESIIVTRFNCIELETITPLPKKELKDMMFSLMEFESIQPYIMKHDIWGPAIRELVDILVASSTLYFDQIFVFKCCYQNFNRGYRLTLRDLSRLHRQLLAINVDSFQFKNVTVTYIDFYNLEQLALALNKLIFDKANSNAPTDFPAIFALILKIETDWINKTPIDILQFTRFGAMELL